MLLTSTMLPCYFTLHLLQSHCSTNCLMKFCILLYFLSYSALGSALALDICPSDLLRTMTPVQRAFSFPILHKSLIAVRSLFSF